MTAGGRDASLKELVKGVSDELKKAGYKQSPQLEGSSVLMGKPFLHRVPDAPA